jgi:UDP-N-acetylmuramoyl-tripeptide--D-alanyl-D-alanine ligase
VAAFAEIHPGPVVTYGLGGSADVRPETFHPSAAGVRFRVEGIEFETASGGRHNLTNWMAALAVARVLEIDWDRLREAVASFRTGRMRCERLEHRGMVVWNDCYNANPEAMKSMLDVLMETPARRRIAVLGEMLELGRSAEPLHREIGSYIVERGIDVLVGIRGAARFMVDEAVRAGLSGGAAHFFDDPRAAGQFVREIAREGDALLFKGSRGVQVERALEPFLAEEAP